MEPIKLRDSRAYLVIDILCTVFFVLCLIFSTISSLQKQDMDALLTCVLIFGFLTLLSLVLFPYFFRRKLLLYDRYVSYTPAFGKTRAFSYSEIGYILPRNEKFIIYSYDGRKLAVFENNMPAFPAACNYLAEKNVKFAPQKPLRPASFIEKRTREWNRSLNLTDLDSYIASRWSLKTILKQKKITRILRILLVILSILAIPLPDRWRLTVHMLIPLSSYFFCLTLYPRITMESGKKCDQYHITVPFWSNVICMVFLADFLKLINLDGGWWLSMSAILTAVLALPFLIILWLRKIKEHPLRLLLAACSLFALCMLTVPALNYVTATETVHERVTVLEKESHHNSHVTYCSVMVFWRGELQKMNVSNRLYRSVEEGDILRVCVKKSIFGRELWQVHR